MSSLILVLLIAGAYATPVEHVRSTSWEDRNYQHDRNIQPGAARVETYYTEHDTARSAQAAAPVKVETYSWEEQHQKQIKSAPVHKPRQDTYLREEHLVKHSDLADHHPVLEQRFPSELPQHVPVNESAAYINIQELESKFTTAESQGQEGLNAFLDMINKERHELQRAYDQMAVQAEANVRGSLAKSREWELKAKEQAKQSLERLVELQRKAEEKTTELINRHKQSQVCALCEQKVIETAIQSQAHAPVRSGTFRSTLHDVETVPIPIPSTHHIESEVRRTHDSNLDNVETTTTVEEWSTVYEDHSSTVYPAK
jgi:hypothetical protein